MMVSECTLLIAGCVGDGSGMKSGMRGITGRNISQANVIITGNQTRRTSSVRPEAIDDEWEVPFGF